MDVLKFEPVVKKVVSSLKVPKARKEDLTQECYLALLQQQEILEKATEPQTYARKVCYNRIRKLWREENQMLRWEDKPPFRLDSMSDPKVAHKVAKIGLPEGPEVSDEKLYSAVISLPIEESRVIWNLFIEGRTERETAADLGMTRWRVQVLSKRGVNMLKKIFEVE